MTPYTHRTESHISLVALPLVSVVIEDISHVIDIILDQFAQEDPILSQLFIAKIALKVLDLNAIIRRGSLVVLAQVVHDDGLAQVATQQAQILNGKVSLELAMLTRQNPPFEEVLVINDLEEVVGIFTCGCRPEHKLV